MDKMRKKRKRKKIKNFILKSITWCAGVLFMISVCAADSPSWIPSIVSMVCMAWLALFAYANGMMNEYCDEEEGDFYVD